MDEYIVSYFDPRLERMAERAKVAIRRVKKDGFGREPILLGLGHPVLSFAAWTKRVFSQHQTIPSAHISFTVVAAALYLHSTSAHTPPLLITPITQNARPRSLLVAAHTYPSSSRCVMTSVANITLHELVIRAGLKPQLKLKISVCLG
jgi:hypothetical protein